MTTTEPTATIICTKSQFRAALSHEFAVAMATATEASMDDVREAIEALAKDADRTRGVFQGYSDYLDLAYVVAPDEKYLENCAVCGGSPQYPARNCIASFHDVEIPATSDEDDEDECEGHESLSGARMGETVYCDGSCRKAQQPDAPKCADCDAPAVRTSAPEYSAGVDAAAKPRCERHARPVRPLSVTVSDPVLDLLAERKVALKIPAVTDEQRASSREAADATLREAIRTLNGTAAMLREHSNDPQMIEALARDVWQLANVLQAAAGHLRIAQQ